MAIENATVLINESINQTAPSMVSDYVNYTQTTLWPRMHDLIVAPAKNPDMLWTLAPLMIALILMQLYFGHNKDEALGWNTAFGNSIALIFISVSLLRTVYLLTGKTRILDFLWLDVGITDIRILIIGFLFLYGILLSMLSFFHWLPEKIAFFVMNGISINVTAYVAIVLVNSENIPLDRHTVIAGVVIFVLVYIIATILKSFIPTSIRSRVNILERKKHILENKAKLFKEKAEKTENETWKKWLEMREKKCRERVDGINDTISGLKKK